MNKTLLVLIPAALGIGVGLLLATEESGPAQAPTEKQVIVRKIAGPDHSAEVRELRREVRTLLDQRSEQDALPDQAPSTEDADVDELDNAADTSLEPHAAIEANMAALVEQAHELERWFYEQDADPNWTPTAENSLQGAFSEQDGLVFEADCAASACRLEFEFKDAEVRDNTMSEVPLLLPWPGEAFMATLDEEGLTVTVYVAREGASLPRTG